MIGTRFIASDIYLDHFVKWCLLDFSTVKLLFSHPVLLFFGRKSRYTIHTQREGEGHTSSYIIWNSSVRICPSPPLIYCHLLTLCRPPLFYSSGYIIIVSHLCHWELFQVDSWVKGKNPGDVSVFGFQVIG